MDQLSFLENTNSNIDTYFGKTLEIIQAILLFIFNAHTWSVIGIISSVLSVFFIGIIIFSLIRLFEIQAEEDGHINHEIHEALEKMKEKEKNENPRWHYVRTLGESPSESDWRVAIIESDSMLEEALKMKGFSGGSVSELLEAARESGYRSLQNAWDAHLVRNQIAHLGVDFPLSQVEARRVIHLYQNFFEEIGII
jgi:hypothetical protein